MGDHTETVQIDYDPSRVSYEQLLKLFWQLHNPTSNSVSRQYMHAVFYHNDRQKKAAEKSLADWEAATDLTVETKILPVREFTRAEGYHQKYILRQYAGLAKELTALYPDVKDFTDSTAAARLNGYIGGHGDTEQLERELPNLGLSPSGNMLLNGLVQYRR